MIDTGAALSVVSLKYCNRNNIPITPLKVGQNDFLTAAGGETIQLLGTVDVDLEFGAVELPYTFAVLANVIHDLIIGFDFLHDYGATIDCQAGVISLHDGAMHVSLLSNNFVHSKGAVRLLSRTYFPPMSETVVAVRASAAFDGSDCLLEGAPVGANAVLIVARALVRPQRLRTLCKIINPSTRGVVLRHNFCVAKIELAQASTLATMAMPDLSRNESESATMSEPTTMQNSANAGDDDVSALGMKLGNGNLSPEQEERLRAFLQRYRDVFATKLLDLTGTTLYYHAVDTIPGATPPRCRAYKHSPDANAEIERQTQEMLDANIIRPSCSPYAAPVLLVKKKNGQMRGVVDFRKLNAIIKPTHHPLPDLGDILDALGGGEGNSPPGFFVSSLDMRSGYYQVPLRPEDCHKTAFVTHTESYEFTKLPMGLSSSPGSSSLLMSHVFRGLNFKFVVPYLDDLLVYTRGAFDTHLEHLAAVFTRLREAGLKLHPNKCVLAASETTYLGFKLSRAGCTLDDSKVEIIANYPRPQSTKDLRRFHGFVSFYRSLVPGFSQICSVFYRSVCCGVMRCLSGLMSARQRLLNYVRCLCNNRSARILICVARLSSIATQAQSLSVTFYVSGTIKASRVLCHAAGVRYGSQRRWPTAQPN